MSNGRLRLRRPAYLESTFRSAPGVPAPQAAGGEPSLPAGALPLWADLACQALDAAMWLLAMIAFYVCWCAAWAAPATGMGIAE